MNMMRLLLPVLGLLIGIGCRADGLVTINVSELRQFPNLESVSRAFSEQQKPEVMFLGVTRRFKDSSLDQIAESSLAFFETHPANLSGIIYQVLTISNVSSRILHGEAVSPAHRIQLRKELATYAETKRLLQSYLQNVPAGSKILVPRDGKLCDIRAEATLIEHTCYAASASLMIEPMVATCVARL